MKYPFLVLAALALFLEAGAIGVAAQPLKETSIWQIEVEPLPSEPGKYAIKGSVFGIGDPVHETLTLNALIAGGAARAGTARNHASVVQYMRGVFWNDDPCAQLFMEDDFSPLRPSFGYVWYVDFQTAKKAESQRNDFTDLQCKLLGRSHFGDLQFFHGMADHNGVKADETAARVYAWSSVAYRIAMGEIDASLPLESDAAAKSLLLSIGNWSAKRLFRAKTVDETRARALGSLLHMIQDSYAHGHVTRASDGPVPGAILQFLSYVDQDEKKHAHDDSWSNGTNDLQRTLAIPGAREALAASTEIVRLYRAGATWADVEKHLKGGPLFVAPEAQVSGPGKYK